MFKILTKNGEINNAEEIKQYLKDLIELNDWNDDIYYTTDIEKILYCILDFIEEYDNRSCNNTLKMVNLNSMFDLIDLEKRIRREVA